MNVQNVAEDFIVSVDRIEGLKKLGFTKNEIYQLVAPARTLGRRTDKLSLEESDRVQRLERLAQDGIRVFGCDEKFNRWLRKPNRALKKAVPIDLLISETGASTVKEQIQAIEFGVFD